MPGGNRLQLRPRAVALVAAGEQYTAIAAQLGINERTVRRWNEGQEFAAQVQAIQVAAIKQARGRLAIGMAAAAETLVRLLDDPDPRIRLHAAREILSAAGRVRDEHLLEERLAALECQAAHLTEEEAGDASDD